MGFDFGSTTSSAVAAQSRVGTHRFSGEVSVQQPKIIYRSRPVFTPFDGEELDLSALHRIIEGWMREARLTPADIFSGGAIVTGLAALQANAEKIAALVQGHAGESLIATADDPALESWLAFMGSARALSLQNPSRAVLNVDIGGGTTNPALGLNGEVLGTGCAFIGARHFRFRPGTYRLTGISAFGEQLTSRLGLRFSVGDTVDAGARECLLDGMVGYLEEMVAGRSDGVMHRRFAFLEQLPLDVPDAFVNPLITFSGGVGEIVYSAALGDPLPGTTAFGDLGIDLARRIAVSPILARDLRCSMPETRGHATVYGLALHHTEISGTTLFMSHPDWLPLKDLPVVARLGIDAGPDQLAKILGMALQSRKGSAIQVSCQPCHAGGSPAVADYRRFGSRVRTIMQTLAWPGDRPLVFLLTRNCGKAVGNYASDWGRHPLPLLVLDEIPCRDAHFVTIGRPKGALVPVSFFGMSPPSSPWKACPAQTDHRSPSTDQPQKEKQQ